MLDIFYIYVIFNLPFKWYHIYLSPKWFAISHNYFLLSVNGVQNTCMWQSDRIPYHQKYASSSHLIIFALNLHVSKCKYGQTLKWVPCCPLSKCPFSFSPPFFTNLNTFWICLFVCCSFSLLSFVCVDCPPIFEGGWLHRLCYSSCSFLSGSPASLQCVEYTLYRHTHRGMLQYR